MKFTVYRTSEGRYSDRNPIQPEDVKKYKTTRRSHKKERELSGAWEIQITSLAQLLKLVEDYGEIVITPKHMVPVKNKADFTHAPNGIEIYDNYRE